jgi:small subunit ribosomal protein S2
MEKNVNTSKSEVQTDTNSSVQSLPKLPGAVKLNFEIPDIKEFLKTGAQFGHQNKRWNPKMQKYIFGKRGDIHIIDLSQTIPLLEQALKFLVSASMRGRVLFVGTKRQAAEILKDEAKRSGAYYIIHRWPGGLFTNFKMINRSLKKLEKLEADFEAGIEGRTKYEISQMKKDWERLNRLYAGVKTMDRKPRAIVIVDPNFEKNAVREAIRVGVPIVAIIDTNSDPDGINYPIPANDDAIKSLKLLIKLFGEAVLQGNEGKGVKHEEKDYAKVEVKIVKEKQETKNEEVKELKIEEEAPVVIEKVIETPKKTTKEDKEIAEKGILGRSREKSLSAKSDHDEKEKKNETVVKKEKPVIEKEKAVKKVEKKEKPTAKKTKKTEKKETKKSTAKKIAKKK